MKKMRNIAIIVVLVLGAYWLGSFYQWGGQRTEVTSDLIKNRLEQTAELASTNYYYTNMGSYEDYHLFMGHNIPLTGKKFIVSYDGLIKSGIDLDQVAIEVKDEKIQVTMPPARILSHEVFDDSWEIFDESFSIFNPTRVTDYTSFIQEQRKEVEAEALEKGLLTQATKDSEAAIHALIEAMLPVDEVENYQIELKVQLAPPQSEESGSQPGSELSVATDNEGESDESSVIESAA